MNKERVLNASIWVISALVAALFLLSAIPKFFDPGWVSRFARWGYTEGFLYLIAVLETLGAIGLLWPKWSAYAAVGLIGIMLGAMYTHLTHDQGIVWNLMYVVLLLLIAWHRWPQRTHRR
ncbi:DoxX family protein [Marinicella meishanensis]|uniref:DoxX family protein n=1 Tax=Marinicella meishanensis TaxID=2873263 RepID=UPI001CC0D14A|nr:DoxX family protein [Marinicella sp. NBU2979]